MRYASPVVSSAGGPFPAGMLGTEHGVAQIVEVGVVHADAVAVIR